MLGFDKFNAEDTMENVDIDGDYISDLAMSKEIIAELEEQKQANIYSCSYDAKSFSIYRRPIW